MKVMLIMPNFRWSNISSQYTWESFPTNLCMLAAMIEDICEVTILDAYVNDYSPADVRHFVEQYKPDLAGVTCNVHQCSTVAYETLSLIKQERPACLTALGGVYVTVEPENVMKVQSVDYAFVGEGEYTLRNLILFLYGRGEFPEKGVWYRENGQVIDKGRADFIENLDALPIPAYHLIDYHKYANRIPRPTVESPNVLPNARILTSRGCPYHCSFCQVEKISGRKFRARSAANILNEIEFLKREYGIKSLTFDDDNLHTSRGRAFELFNGMIQRSLTMPWKAITTAVWRLDEEQIDLMKRSGCTYVNISIEAGSKRVREDLIRKPVDIEYAKKMVKYLQKCDIYVAANIIIGYPTETWEEIRESFKVIEEMNVDYVKLFSLMPLKYTKAWDDCIEAGMLSPEASSETIGWFTLNCSEFTGAELSILRAFEWDRINFSSREKIIKTAKMMNITTAEIDIMRKKARRNACLQVKEYPIPAEYL
jgi:anaerobic magnesium-protoporphyrin IX monomethyl ester cyclase